MKKIAIVLLLCGVFIVQNSFSKQIMIDFDISQFKGAEGTTSLDFSYSFADTNLKFIYDSAGVYNGEVYFDILLIPNTGDSIRNEWKMPVSVLNYDGTFKELFYGSVIINVPPNEYELQITVKDWLDKERTATTKLQYHVKSFRSEEPLISDIKCAEVIEKISEASRNWSSIFEKNGYFVIPNTKANYSNITGNLLIYSELYNLQNYMKKKVKVNYDILNSAKTPVMHYEKAFSVIADNIVNVEIIPIDTLATGAYYLEITLEYPSEKPNLTTKKSVKKFFYSNANKAPQSEIYFIENLSFEKSEFAVMSEIEVDDFIKKSLVVGLKEDLNTWEAIKDSASGLKAKQRYLYKFWKMRDSDTTTAINETLLIFRERLSFVNKMYSFGKVPGWKTDRGYVTLKYGNPNTIENYNVMDVVNPYDIWQYDNYYGGIYFVFVDNNSLQHMKLVHSTAPGEIANPNWEDLFLRQSIFDDYDTGERKVNFNMPTY